MIIRLSVFIIFVCCLGLGDAVMTPTVQIREEKPSKDSTRVRTNLQGQIEVIGLVGQPVIMECLPFNIDESAKVHWVWRSKMNNTVDEQINDGMRAKDTSRWTITRGTASKNAIRLEIPTVSPAYEGTLECRIDYIDNSQPITAKRILIVYAEPKIVQYQSSFETTVLENENVTLRCNSSGIPRPLIYWRRIGGSSAVIRGHGREMMGTSITFSKTQASDRGLYLCQAYNVMGSVSWSVNLIVQFKPIISIFTGTMQSEIAQKVGCQAQIQCMVTSNPAPTSIQWSSKKSSKIKDNGKRVRTYKMAAADYTMYYTLSFEPTKSSDFTTYTCTGTNAQGSASKSVVLKTSAVGQADLSGLVRCKSGHNTFPSILLISVLLLLTQIKI